MPDSVRRTRVSISLSSGPPSFQRAKRRDCSLVGPLEYPRYLVPDAGPFARCYLVSGQSGGYVPVISAGRLFVRLSLSLLKRRLSVRLLLRGVRLAARLTESLVPEQKIIGFTLSLADRSPSFRQVEKLIRVIFSANQQVSGSPISEDQSAKISQRRSVNQSQPFSLLRAEDQSTNERTYQRGPRAELIQPSRIVIARE